MKNILMVCVLSTIAVASPTPAQSEQPLTQDQFVNAVDKCLAVNEQTEFDTPADVVARISASCSFTASVRFPARGHPVLGDPLRYDASQSHFIWHVQLDEQNRFYGGGASPYRLGVKMDSTGRPVRPSFPADVITALGDVGNANFLLLPLFRTAASKDSYVASNAFGASREVLRSKETRYGVAFQIPKGLTNMNVLTVPLEASKAREISDNLDILLTFRVQSACGVCYKADTLERGVEPTVRTPIETEITTHFLYAALIKFDVIDRVSGRVAYSAGPAQ